MAEHLAEPGTLLATPAQEPQPAPGAGAAAAPRRRTYVLVHGGFHGGWCWRTVAELLRDRGHAVYTPTQTGCGERSHLLSASITLDTFVDDIANVLVWEDLHDVVLVGHSFGGSSISGVADRMPERVGLLVYLDAVLLQNGQTMFDMLEPDVIARRMLSAQDYWVKAHGMRSVELPTGHDAMVMAPQLLPDLLLALAAD